MLTRTRQVGPAGRALFVFLLILVGIGVGLAVWRPAPLMRLFGDAPSNDIYYCPMHPTYTSDRPGDCPICNMKLVKRTTGQGIGPTQGHSGHQPSALSPRAFTLQEILRMKPGEICLLHHCTSGTCQMLPMTEESVRSGKCPGCGEALGILVKDFMPEGYTKVVLDGDKQKLVGVKTAPAQKKEMIKSVRTAGRIAHDPELYQAQEEYLQSLAALKTAQGAGNSAVKLRAEKLIEASRLKLKHMGLSDALIKDVEISGKSDHSLLYGEPGGSVWLYAPIYEYEIPLVHVGDQVEVELPSVPGKKFPGVIRYIDTVLDPVTRSVRLRSVLENPDGMLKPEMYVNALIRISLGNVLAIPAEAVFSTGEKNIVFVAAADGEFQPREVVLGARVDNDYEVKSGVGEGEKVVTSGNFLIDSESRLKAALEGMAGADSGHHHGQ